MDIHERHPELASQAKVAGHIIVTGTSVTIRGLVTSGPLTLHVTGCPAVCIEDCVLGGPVRICDTDPCTCDTSQPTAQNNWDTLFTRPKAD
jgi:hypothetical protein